jgi:hypothetical protein
MVSVSAHQSTRVLTLLWVAALLAPASWAAALGILFSLTDETCVSGSRAMMSVVASMCVVLAAAPAVIAWPWRQSVSPATAAGERTRFMLGIAVGGSLLFALVTLLTAVPIVFLDPCRT